METTYNTDQTAVRIIGDYSPHPIYVMADTAILLGGIESTYHEIKRLQHADRLPRMGSSSHPLTLRDMRYARENEQRGMRFWQYKSLEGPCVKESTGYDCVYGYGHYDGTDFVFVNAADEIVYRIVYRVDPA